MKYIYKRNEYQKINEIVNSDDLKVEFGDTIIGGTLHRLLGVGRSAIKNVEIEQYAKKLDRILAGMVVKPSLDNLNETRPEEEHISMEDISVDGRKLVAIKEIERAVELYRNDKKEEAQKALPPHEVIEALGLPITIEMVKQIEYTKYEVDTIKVTPGDMAIYKGSQVQVINVDGEEIRVRNEDEEEGSVNIEDLEISNNNNDNIENHSDEIREYRERLERLMTACEKCEIDIGTLGETIPVRIDQLERGWTEAMKNELESVFRQANRRCEQCVSESITTIELKGHLDSISLILERYEEDKSTESFISEGQFKNLRKELDKKASTLKITEEELRKLDKEINNRKGIGDITGDQAKAVLSILTKAKNSLLHNKPYEEIRKKQKRYYDKLDSTSNTGRAINRKGYQKWVERVNDMLSYYKDKLPKRVLTMIADSLDKEHISNDYVKLNKEFLGIDVRNKNDHNTSTSIDTFKRGTTNNKLGFVGVDKIQLSQNLQKISFILEIKSNEYSGYITGLVTKSRRKDRQFNFKFITGLNSAWLEPYFGGKTVLDKSITPSDNIEFENNNDLKNIVLKKDKNVQVYYAQLKVNDKFIKKNDILQVSYLSLTDHINKKGLEIRSENWTISKVGILVGYSDHLTAENNVNSNTTLIKGDKFLTDEDFTKFYNVFTGESDIDESENDKPKTIKYKSEKGTIERDVISWDDDGSATIKGTDGETYKISKDQII